MSNLETPLRIRVAPVSAELAAAVLALRVIPAQTTYVGDIAFNLADAQRDPFSDAMAVLADDRVIGCYRLDLAPNTVAGRDLGEPTLGLRAMLIDRDSQGRGAGTLALQACCEDAGQRHPDRRLLVLAVHCDNQTAVAAYTRAGFRDTGERLSGGAGGPQQLMLRRQVPSASIASDQATHI